MRILLLGGTTEAGDLARALALGGHDAIYSYAGRTQSPAAQPLPQRVGGFGGITGLADWIRHEGISHVIDATHPFANEISGNAVAACAQTRVPLLALERPPWVAGPGDRWTDVADVDAAVAALPDTKARVFLAIGRQSLAPFAAKPQHSYLLRLIDEPGEIPLPHAIITLSRGPFSEPADRRLLQDHAITHVVAKNSGGSAAEAKLAAARSLGLPVIMIARPPMPPRASVTTVGQVLDWLGHSARLGVKT